MILVSQCVLEEYLEVVTEQNSESLRISSKDIVADTSQSTQQDRGGDTLIGIAMCLTNSYFFE